MQIVLNKSRSNESGEKAPYLPILRSSKHTLLLCDMWRKPRANSISVSNRNWCLLPRPIVVKVSSCTYIASCPFVGYWEAERNWTETCPSARSFHLSTTLHLCSRRLWRFPCRRWVRPLSVQCTGTWPTPAPVWLQKNKKSGSVTRENPAKGLPIGHLTGAGDHTHKTVTGVYNFIT